MKLYDVIKKEKMEKSGIIEVAPPEYPEELFTEKKVKLPKKRKKLSLRTIGLISLIIFILAGLYLLGMRFVFAKVIIKERIIPFSFDRIQFELEEEKIADPGRLSFQVMSVDATTTKQVYASGLQQSNTKASGKVVIFNEYSTSPRTIKSGTTLTSADGKKYVTQAAVTVPGFTTVNKVKKAGTSPEVTVVAAATGESYNTAGTSFTVSGYTSSQIYARSAGAIKGGEAGMAHVLTEKEKEDAMLSLQAGLAERLKRETRAAIPPEYITFPNLQVIDIDKNSLVLKGSTISFPASIEGKMVSYLIARDDLERALASKLISEQTYPDVVIPTIEKLTVEPLSSLSTNIDKIPETITIAISGEGTIVTKVSPEKVRQVVLGIPRKAFEIAMQSISEIEEARYVFYPFWAPLFPSIQDRITVIIQ